MDPLFETVAPWAATAAIYGFPLWLAWWLSDGFADWQLLGGSAVAVRPAYNPYTGHPGSIVVNADTAAPLTFPE